MTVKGFKIKIVNFLINSVFVGTRFFIIKRKLLNSIGNEIGKGTKVVGPVYCTGKLTVGKNCWLGKNLFVNGNGEVIIGDNCDIAPEVTFQTGSHEIGVSQRRAGKGFNKSIAVGNGCWLGVRSTVLSGMHIGDGVVVAACSCVCKNIDDNSLVGGVPARLIRKLDE